MTGRTPEPSVQTGKSVLLPYGSVWAEMRLVVTQSDCSSKGENKGRWPLACHGIPLLALGIHEETPGMVLCWPIRERETSNGQHIRTLHTNSSKLRVSDALRL